ncbi:MAG TPA: 6-phospho-beta-glucosidase [Candidatus Limnocylindria bacterium]|nr:6-phospho-beta-glucosidase [Candidatus Limnocylindria bacterium]
MAVKVVVVGGGSTYTPELIEGFADRDAVLHVEDLVLLDVDRDRLDVVGGLARRMLERRGWPGRLSLTTGQDGAFEGADFVLLQIRVGGQGTRFVDETLPHRFGCIGQETTGPGGFAKALRTVPVVLDIAEAATRRAAPGAWIIDFTNPVGIVTQALVDGGFRAIGLCNVAIGMQRTFARRFGVEPERVELEHVGLNHLSWERAIRVDGTDVLPGLLESDGPWLADMVSLPEELVRALRSVPSYYLRYFYMTDVVLAEQLAGKSRAEDVMAIERDLLERYRDPALAEKPRQLEERGGAFYSEAAAQLIAALATDAGDVQVVNLRNGGAIPGLPADEIVEIGAHVGRDGVVPIPVAPLGPELLGLVLQLKAYERLTIQAALSGDREMALLALLANPLVARYSTAAPLLDALLDANRRFLPRFFPEA